MHTSAKDIKTIENDLKHDVRNVETWCLENKMKINESKSKCMLIGARQKISKLDTKEINVDINSHILENVHVEKLLGVHIDQNLDFTSHINFICKNISSKISLLKKIKQHLSLNHRKLFYNAYILPSIDYCLAVWGNTSKGNIERINKLQKYAARVILDKPPDSPSQPLFDELDWLNVYERIEYNKGVMLYKSLNGLCPSYMSDLFSYQNTDVYNLRSSSNLDLHLPRPIHENFKRSFQYSGVQIWNKLPSSLRCSNSLTSFKSSLSAFIKSKR